MPGRPKTGPPYTDIPDEIYVVVTNPWSVDPDPRERRQTDFNRIAAWAQVVLHKAGLNGGRPAAIECVYSMGTRDEVILQFEAGTNIIPLLGEHRWANFTRDWTGNPNDASATRVFIYNWKNNGDPGTHNWIENFPNQVPLDVIPVKSPYPAPSWTRPPPNLTSFVQPIPLPPLPPPAPNQDTQDTNERQEAEPSIRSSTETQSPSPSPQDDQPEPEEPPAAQDAAPRNLFRPYEPPLQHPSHAQFVDQEPADRDGATSRACPFPPPAPKLIKKLDPYELEEDAFLALREPEPDEGGKKDAVKTEDTIPPFSVEMEIKTEDSEVIPRPDSEYEPSQALVDALSSLKRMPSPASAQTRDPRTRRIPGATRPAGSEYEPSVQLAAEINNYLASVTPTASSPSAPRVVVKREYEEEVIPSRGDKKRIKVEEY